MAGRMSVLMRQQGRGRPALLPLLLLLLPALAGAFIPPSAGARSAVGPAGVRGPLRAAAAAEVAVEKDSRETKAAFERLFVRIAKAEGPNQVPPGALDEALNLAARGRSWSRAMKLLRLPHVEPTLAHYQLAIAACRNADHKWRQALELLDEAQAKGLAPPPQTFVEVMAICAASQRPKEAVAVLDRMAKAGVPAGLGAFNVAVTALAKEGQWKKALKILQYMERQAVWPDSETYTQAIAACARAGEWQRALVMLEEMVKKGVPPTTATYNAAMRACQRGGQGERALAFFEEMVRKTLGVDADSVAVAIASCGTVKNRLEKALELYEVTLPELGLPITKPVVEALAGVLVPRKRWAEAERMVNSLPADPKAPSPNRGEAALALVKACQQYGVPLEGKAADFILRTLLASGRVGDAVRAVVAASQSRDDEEEGEGEGRNALLDAISGSGATEFSPEVQALGMVLAWQRRVAGQQAAARAASGQDGPRLADPGEQVTSDEELETIRQLCEAGQLEAAVESIKAKALAGTKPRPSVVNLAMEYAVVIFRDVTVAKSILEIPGAGGRAFYNRALRVAAAARRWGTVASLLKKMQTNEIVPDAQTYLGLIVGAKEGGVLTRVQRYHHLMESNGIPLEAAHRDALMETYVGHKKGSLALGVFRSQEPGAMYEDPALVALALEACALDGLAEDAEQIVSAAQLDLDLPINAAARAALLTAIAKGSEASEAASLVKARAEGLKASVATDTAAGNAYLLALARSEGAVDALIGALDGMAAPDALSYELAMDALLKAEKLEQAAALFGKMRSSSLVPTPKGVTLAMTALLRAGKPAEALALLPVVGGKGVEPTDGVVRAAVKAAMALGGGKEALAAVQQHVSK